MANGDCGLHRAVLFAALVRLASAPKAASELTDIAAALEKEFNPPFDDLAGKITTVAGLLATAPADADGPGFADAHYAAWLLYVSLAYPTGPGQSIEAVWIGPGLGGDDTTGLRLALHGEGAKQGSGLARQVGREVGRISSFLAPGASCTEPQLQDGAEALLVLKQPA